VTRKPVIFVTGASRSGTTLLSFVLRNHSAVFGLRELQYFGQAWDPRDGRRRFAEREAIEAAANMLARQEHGALTSVTGGAHRREAAAVVSRLGPAGMDPAELYAAVVNGLAAAAGKSIACEQTPRNIFYARALLELYPAAHVVHIVRDPRAVMASQKKRWQRRRLSSSPSRVPRYESLRVWVNYHPYTIARLWSHATAEALALEAHPRVTLVRFEDLVREPEATVRRLCERIGLGYEPRMLEVGQVNSSHRTSAGGTRRGLHSDAIDQWRDVLSPAEIDITESMCASWMRRLGYESQHPRDVFWGARAWYRLSYMGHLAGVLMVNPNRAYVQSRALRRHQPLGYRAPADTAAKS
jgi:omega-hydroxy-beta-dihydromenaquinone-9 sulfotransferase